MGTGKGLIRVKERGSKGVERREKGERGGSFITHSAFNSLGMGVASHPSLKRRRRVRPLVILTV